MSNIVSARYHYLRIWARRFYLRLRRILYSVAGDIGQILFKKIIQVITVFLEGKFFLA
jgi:hypothetical protein